jgi:zinc protease
MFGGGNVADPEGKSGLAQLHAGAMRGAGAGDRSADAVDALLERIAADLTASADAYATVLNLSVQSADLATGLGVVTDMLRRPRFEPGRVELTRKGVLEELRRQQDQAPVVARKALVSNLYRGHALGDLPTLESVTAIRLADLQHYHGRFARPDNLWLAVSGDIDVAGLKDLLSRLFAGWESPSERGPWQLDPLPPPPSPSLLLVHKDLPQTTVMFAQRGITKDDPDLYALRVLDFILGGGSFNSRLMQEVRTRRGLAYSVYSYFQVGRRLPGLFVAGTETKNASVAEVVTIMRQEMQAMREQTVTDAELALAKESLINSFVFAFEDAHEVVSQTMRLAFYDYPADYLGRYRERLAAVTANDVLAAARRHLDPGAQIVLLVGDPDGGRELANRLDLPIQTLDAGTLNDSGGTEGQD